MPQLTGMIKCKSNQDFLLLFLPIYLLHFWELSKLSILLSSSQDIKSVLLLLVKGLETTWHLFSFHNYLKKYISFVLAFKKQ